MDGRTILAARVIPLLLTALLLLALCTCGGNGGGTTAAAPAPADTTATDALVDAVAQPVDVDTALWDELTVELKRVLAKAGAATVPSQPPGNAASAVPDLQVVANLGGTATFTWSYRNVGDYNQDKAVTANDLTGVGQQYEQSTSDGENDELQQVVDGNSDGLITIHDITPIGQNFNRQVDGYVLQTATEDTAEADWTSVATILFEDAVLPEHRGWRGFTLDLAEPVDLRYYRVAPYYATEDNTGVVSNTVQFDNSAAGKPQNVTATQGTLAGGVRVTWSELDGAFTYTVWRSADEEGDYTELDETAAFATEFLDGTAEAGQHYWYRVRGWIAGGWSAYSGPAEGWAMALPTAPQNLSASDGDYTDRVTLAWDAVDGATGYSVHRSETTGSGYEQLDTTTSNTYNDTTAVAGTVYYYVVRAYNAAGNSTPSNEDSGRRAVAGVAPVVESVSPLSAASATGVTFSAVVSGGTPDSYDWQFGGLHVPASSTAASPEVWLGPAGEYDCHLTVTNGFGGDTFDFSLDVTDPALVPVVTGVTPRSGASTALVTFNATVTAGTPTEWEWDFGGGADPNTSTAESPAVELGAEGTYSAWVRAANANGEDTYAFTLNVGEVPPPPYDPPTDLSASDGTSTSVVTLTWTKSTGATGYRIYRDSPGTPVNTIGDVATWDDHGTGDYLEHTYWVRATGPEGDSDLSDSDTGWRRLPAPTGLAASDGGHLDRVRLTWTGVTGATGYTVYRDGMAAASLGDVSTWDDTAPGDYAEHTYTVRADNALGQSVDSAADTGYLGLAAPTGLSASDGTYTDRIHLTWTQSSGATGYEVHRDGGLLQTLGGVATWDDTAPGDHAQHTYAVKALNSLDTSEASASDTGYLGLEAPTNLSASDGTQTDRIALTWTKSSGATGYEIYRDNQSNLIQSVGDIAAWDDTGVGGHAQHTYWLKATNSLDTSSFSASDTGFRRLNVPTGVSAGDGTYTDRINVSWTGVTDATGYKVYRDSSLAATLGDVSTWDDTGVSDFTQHSYQVSATNSLGEGSQSTADTGYVGVAAPTGLAASDGTYQSKVRLTWTGSSGATGYRIYRDDQSTLIQSVGLVTSWDDTTLTDYDPHDYWLKAIGPYSDSGYSVSDSGYRSQYAWQEHTIDSAANVGEGSCLRVVNGVPMVSYRDATNNDVKFAVSGVAAPDEAADWTTYTMDGSGTVGQYLTSLVALGSVPAVAYYDANNPSTTNPNLKIAIAANGNPGSGDWSFHYADETLVNGRYPSMVVEDGRLAVAYQYFTAKDVKFARAQVAVPAQASDWTVHTIEDSGNLGNEGISLAVHGGYFTVAYCKEPTGPQARIAIASVAEPAADTDWSIHYIESGDLGQYPSVTTWNGNLAVSYLDNSSSRVRFARATTDPPASELDWVTLDVDTTYLSGMYGTSLVIDPDGYPGIAFHYATDADLMYSGTTDNACDGPEDWTAVTVDNGTAAGYWPSLTTVAGVPAMTYQAGGNLKYAVYAAD